MVNYKGKLLTLKKNKTVSFSYQIMKGVSNDNGFVAIYLKTNVH